MKKELKIAMVIDAWDPILGGGQIHVKNVCRELIQKHSCRIDLFVRALKGDDGKEYSENEEIYDGKLQVIRCGRPKDFFYFPERILSMFSLFFAVIKRNKQQKYDIIHAHSFLGLFSGKMAAAILGLPIFAVQHGSNLLDTGEKTFYYYIEKFLLTYIRYDILISSNKRFLKYKNRNKNIKIIANGVNKEDFESVDSDTSKDIFKILFVGRLEWTKGIDILIESIAKIDENLLNKKRVEFHLVGYGYDEQKYKNMVEQYNLGRYIIFRGKITGKNLVKEYKSSNLFILPSRTEGFGISVIEAMISKTLVISTRCGGPEEIIDDGINGLLVDVGNTDELSKKLQQCIVGDILGKESMIELAYEKVMKNYTWDIIASQVYEEYLNILR